jgi:hypothetical protein
MLPPTGFAACGTTILFLVAHSSLRNGSSWTVNIGRHVVALNYHGVGGTYSPPCVAQLPSSCKPPACLLFLYSSFCAALPSAACSHPATGSIFSHLRVRCALLFLMSSPSLFHATTAWRRWSRGLFTDDGGFVLNAGRHAYCHLLRSFTLRGTRRAFRHPAGGAAACGVQLHITTNGHGHERR